MKILVCFALLAIFAVAGITILEANNPTTQRGILPHWRVLVEEPPYGERFDHTLVVHNNRMWLLGGNTSREWKNDVWVTDDGERWERVLESAPWTPRAQHRTVVFDGRIWVIGGNDGNNRGDVWASADGVEWELITEEVPFEKRTDFCAEVLGGRILIFGGMGDWRRLNDVWATSNGRDWELLTSEAPWRPRSHFASVVHKDVLYISGGAFFDFDKQYTQYERGHFVYLGDVWATTDGIEWEETTNFSPKGSRALGRMLSHGNYIFHISGDYDPDTTAISRHTWISEDGRTWNYLRHATGSGLPRRNNFEVAVFKDRFWSIGGVDYTWTFYTYENAVAAMEGDLENPADYFANPPRIKLTRGDPGR